MLYSVHFLTWACVIQPDFKAIKKRIEDLITRDYLERDKDNANMYKYLAWLVVSGKVQNSSQTSAIPRGVAISCKVVVRQQLLPWFAARFGDLRAYGCCHSTGCSHFVNWSLNRIIVLTYIRYMVIWGIGEALKYLFAPSMPMLYLYICITVSVNWNEMMLGVVLLYEMVDTMGICSIGLGLYAPAFVF